MKKLTAVLLSVLLLASSLPISALASEASGVSEAVAADIVETKPEATDSVTQPIENTTILENPAVDEKPTEATPAKAAEPVGAKQEEQPVGKSSFTYTVTNNQVTITGLSDEYLTDLVIPETIEDLPVTAIKGYAFNGCSQITSITVPNSVTSIGNGAFKGTNPTKVTLPFIGSTRGQPGYNSSVFGYIFGDTNSSSTETTTQYYGSSSSYYCIPKTIKEVVISDETIIPYGAFYNCYWIEKININENVTELGVYSFYNCSSLQSFKIPNLITEIKFRTFYNCEALKNIVVPDTLTKYGEGSFSGCTSLENIPLPNELTSIGSAAFSGCSALVNTNLVIPNNVTTIGSYAFSGCSNISNITVPTSVTTIGRGAFYGTNPSKISLPFIGLSRTVSNETEGVFGYIFSYKALQTTDSLGTFQCSYYVQYMGDFYCYYYIPKTIKEVIITDAIQVPYHAFYNCYWIEKVTINDIEDDASKVGIGAFYNCNAMTVYINRDTAVHTYCERNSIRHCSTKSISLDSDSLVLFRNEAKTIGSEVVLINGKVDTEPETVWTSSNSEAASVNRYTGVISAVAPGTATITADSEGVTATAEVTVYFKLDGITLNKASTEIDIHKTEKLTVIYNPDNTTDSKDITWRSSDETVATVDKDGVVSALKKGKATITATGFNGVQATCTVQVLLPITEITFENSAVTIPRGTRQKVPFVVSPSDTTDTYTVTSSDIDIATVDRFGTVVAKKIGTAVITVTSSRGLAESCVVTVNSPASSVTLSQESKSLFVGKTFALTAEMQPKDTTDSITWTSSNEDVAVVTPDGFVTAMSKGTATITATADSGASASCEVEVESNIAATTVLLAYQETEYDGSENLPAVDVYYNGDKLVENTDYSLSYLNNTDVGTASVFVTSLHDGTEVEKQFVIKPLTVRALDISCKVVMTYTGKALKALEEITYQSLRLTEGVDYTVTYENNTNAGAATVTITGMGNFCGATTKAFTIAPKSIESATVTLDVTSYTYDGSTKKPVVTVKDGITVLTEGTDYSISYAKNTHAGDAVVTVMGLNNYGSSTAATFKIYPKSLSGAAVTLDNNIFACDGTKKCPTVTVTENDATLTENNDYKVEYKTNKEPGTATVTIVGQGDYTGTLTTEFSIIQLGDINQNGTVEIQDVTALQRHLAEFTNSDGSPIVDEENEEVFKIADVNHDGIISIADITMIQRYLAEFIDSFA